MATHLVNYLSATFLRNIGETMRTVTFHILSHLSALSMCLFLLAHPAAALETTPFFTFNQSPVVQIYGLPAAEDPVVAPDGRLAARFALDVANSFAVDDHGNETITLDGEVWRTTLAFRYGLGRGWEVGLDLPVVTTWGGVLDDPVQWWHQAFGIGQAGRDDVSTGRTLFTYSLNGTERFRTSRPNAGLGDIRLSSGVQLYRDATDPGRAVALRGSLKLPTGSSGSLHGSGGVDFSLWLTGRERLPLLSERWALLWAMGGMIVGRGDILPEIQRDLVGFGTIGVGWRPSDWYLLKTQLNGHTPFYQGSSLRELSVASVQWVAGGTVAFTPQTELDLSFSEDLLVITSSPDFGITLALRTLF
jgi:uncharacterized protein DUF3187